MRKGSSIAAKLPGGVRRFVVMSPVTMPVTFMLLSAVAMLFLLAERYNAALVLSIGLPAALIGGWLTQRLLTRKRALDSSSFRFDLLALVLILIWIAFNSIFASQHLFTNRDPATYNNAAIWLTTHETIKIEKPAIIGTLGLPEIQAESLGFATSSRDSSVLVAQGAHLLPALQALVGKFAGVQGILIANVLLTGFGLLAFYGFARMHLRKGWALFGLVALASSLPILFVARDSYSESLALLFIFGGLTLVSYAYSLRNRALWFVAGLVFGAAALARVDAFITFAGIVLGLAILLSFARRNRAELVQGGGLFLLGMALMGSLALLDLIYLSDRYFNALRPRIDAELWLLAAASLSAITVIVTTWRTKIFRHLQLPAWLPRVITIAIASLFVILLSRPLWFVGWRERSNGALTRTFSEQTINWLLWYFGPVVVVAAVVALCVLLIRLLRKQHAILLPFLFAFGITAAIYLIRPSITGDQPWATRRFVPIVMPGFVFLALWAIGELWDKTKFRIRHNVFEGRVVSAVLVTLLLVSPLFVTYPFLLRRLYIPEYQQVLAVCQAVPSQSSVIWLGESKDFSVQPVRSICDIDSAGLRDDALTPAYLRTVESMARVKQTDIVVGFYGTDADALPLSAVPDDYIVSTATYHEIDHSYKRAPRNVITLERTIMLGRLDDGTIQPL